MSLNDLDLTHPSAGGTLIALLDSCGRLGWLALAVMLHAALVLMLAAPWLQGVMACVLLLGLIVQYLAARLAFDAALFRTLYRPEADARVFDQAMATLFGGAAPEVPRTLASRWQGTQRLIRHFALGFALQLALWLAALVGGIWY
ncbi:MAG TPA: hypothetical protein VLC08_14820 [Chitinolyticbacter sp.]|uniref:hypothetical protein n=1 Tax=Chitinolyticbacter albus TaxID=2961951 RepID=UPI00210CBB92|nr:hypothetical protein [Chitinolyticbacter albus]HSC81628.1 hypothetical protein [Chitinolyticbacter sp.]